MTIAVFTFIGILGVILGIYWLFTVRPERRTGDALQRRLTVKLGSAQTKAKLLKRARQLSAVPAFDRALARGHIGVRALERLLEQSGSRMTVGVFVLASGFLAFITFVVVQRFARMPIASLILAACASTIPTSLLRYQRTKRMLKFEEQFPEALDLMSRALKAGHAFTTGLNMIAEEMSAPIGPEFKLLYEQQNYGMPMPEALRAFAARIPVLDARFFVTAVLIQRESGGNLSEVLENLASVIRDRFRVKRQIRVISAHGRLTGWVLIGIPPALALVLPSPAGPLPTRRRPRRRQWCGWSR